MVSKDDGLGESFESLPDKSTNYKGGKVAATHGDAIEVQTGSDEDAETLDMPGLASPPSDLDGEELSFNSNADIPGDVERREKIAIDMAVELKPHLEPNKVRGDGNCVFRSIGSHTVGGDMSHSHVRAAVVGEVRANSDRYAQFEKDIEAWCDQMINDGVWGDGVALKAAANAYGRTIVVFRKQHPMQLPTVFLPMEEGDMQDIYLELDESDQGAEHFDPLLLTRQCNDVQSKPKRRKITKKLHESLTVYAAVDSPPPLMRVNASEELAPEGNDADESSSFPPVNASEELPRKRSMRFKRLRLALRKMRKATESSETTATEEIIKAEPTVASPKSTDMAAGSFVIGQLSMPLKGQEGRCQRCSNIVTMSNAKITGKNKTYWACTTCNSRSAQLYKLYGSWPPEQFKTLDEQEKATFYKDVKAINCHAKLKQFVTEMLEVSKTAEKGATDIGEFLPLSVWKDRGYNIKRFRRKCQEIQVHPILGKTYCVRIASKWDSQSEAFKRSQVSTVTDDTRSSSQVMACSRVKKWQQTPEEKAAVREEIRATKAAATQDARDKKQQQVIASKYLRRVVKVNFNMSNMLSSKAAKGLAGDTKDAAATLKSKIGGLEKKLQSIAFGKVGCGDVDGEMCEKTCKAAEIWHGKMLAYLASVSVAI